MIDWELSTIGDPMLDTGWFTAGMRDERHPGVSNTAGLNDNITFPTR